jgi:hypothetical protein
MLRARSTSRRFVHRTEPLEVRVLPASTSVSSSGVLTVNNPNGDLTVETTPVAGQIQITDLSGVVVLNGVTNKIVINGTNLGETIQFIASDGGNQDFGGSLEIKSLNGDDTIDINGRIGGNVKLTTGNGLDTVTTTIGDVTVGGSFVMTDSAGANVFDANGFDYDIGLAMTVNGVSVFSMGGGALLDVGGALTISKPGSSDVPLTVIIDTATTDIGGALKITGGLNDDVVSISSALSLNGSVTMNLGDGNNTFVLTPAAGGTGIAGNLTYTGRSGVDVAVFGAESLIGGNATFNLGGGINTFVDAPTSQYGGNLSIVGENGTNTAVVLGIINGGLSVKLGNGNGNTVVVTAAIGTKFTFRLGNGTLGVLTIAPPVPAIINIDAVFGTGDSTFTLGPNVSLAGKVTGKGGAYTFNQGTAVLLPGLKFKNYP